MDTNLIRAYNVGRNKWYNVTVLSSECYCVKGESVVLNKSIYGLYGESVVKLTLSSKENNDGDLEYTFDLLKMYAVPGMLEMKLERSDSYWNKRLVHLGEDNFCVVHGCDCFRPEYQVIQIIYIEVSEKRSIVTKICLHEFKITAGDIFNVLHCISLPNCKTTALKEGSRFNPEHEAEIVILPPELVQSLDKLKSQSNIIAKQEGGSVSQSSQSADTTPKVLEEDVPKKSSTSLVAAKSNVSFKASTISAVTGHNAKPSSATKASTLGDGAASGRGNTDEEGHSICVRNLPLDFNLRQLDKELKKFGPIKSFRIHIEYSHMSECRFADVEFESETSKQNAIKASVITIGGRIAVIENKRGTGRTQGDSNRTSSSSSSVTRHNAEKKSRNWRMQRTKDIE